MFELTTFYWTNIIYEILFLLFKVPVASLNDYLSMNNLNTPTLTAISGTNKPSVSTTTQSTASSAASENLITRAAMATGINLDPQDSNSYQGGGGAGANTDGVLLSIGAGSAAAGRAASPTPNISALLDISLPSVTEGKGSFTFFLRRTLIFNNQYNVPFH